VAGVPHVRGAADLACVRQVHSRQLLCIGGSQIPFGWSFLYIARVPMVWTEGDIWTTEARGAALQRASVLRRPPSRARAAQVDLPVNSRIEYKYVILEEQARSHGVAATCPTGAGPAGAGAAARRLARGSRLVQPASARCVRRTGQSRRARTRRGW